MIKNKILEKLKKELPGIKTGVELKDYTTYKIGGPAKYFFVAQNKEDLAGAIKIARKNKLPFFILGGGSNLLVSDKGFKGLVIKIDISDIKLDNNKAFVEAGANLTKLAYDSADNGLSGMEWAAGIPGTVGGAIHGNAHAFGTKISDTVSIAETINLKTLKFENFTKKQCQFSLKNSIFKKNKNLIIVSAILEFKKESAEEVKSRIKRFLEYRRTNHPMNFPSAGSTFVNPEVKIKDKKLLEKFPELINYNKRGSVPSGYLIEKCGLAGKKKGNAQISEKHCNFIINLGNAKAKDVLSLMKLAKNKVKDVFGIKLETEIQFIGFNGKII
jgi:UDP-N-acetylmuramate dehydrogenase